MSEKQEAKGTNECFCNHSPREQQSVGFTGDTATKLHIDGLEEEKYDTVTTAGGQETRLRAGKTKNKKQTPGSEP